MTDFNRHFRRFAARLNLRRASYWAACGLLPSLALVAAAPWLGLDWMPMILLSAAFPFAATVAALVGRPATKDVALAADHWSGGEGSILSAVELAPDNPFRTQIEAQALEHLRAGRMPSPQMLRHVILALLVLAATSPLSRYAHAAWSEGNVVKIQPEGSRKPGVDPSHAAELAKNAGTLAEAAKVLGATGQQQLADQLEDAARRAQAGADNKENALRNANALADKAKEQALGQQEREKARDALRENAATKSLAEAAENPAKMDAAAKETAEQLFKDGKVDAGKAQALRDALKQASEVAPHDSALRQAAADAMKELSVEKLAATEKALEKKREALKAGGASDDMATSELKKLQAEQSKQLGESLKEMSKAASLLKDFDPDGKQAQEMMDKMMKDGVTAEQLKKMAEQAQEMSKQLEFDAETLREMVKQGKQFPGLEEHARQLMEKSLKDGKPMDPSAIPDWGKAAKKDLIERTGGKDPREPGKTGDKTGVDVAPRTDGPVDPDKDPKKLDPAKAGSETSNLNHTGNKASGGTVETAEDVERLPRRYRDAARKYFDR